MTVRRDIHAGLVRFLLQADGPGGSLVDHSRSGTVITPGNFATDGTDQLFGVNSFTGQPTFPGVTFSNRFTIEGFIKLALPQTYPQTIIGALDPATNRLTEYALSTTPNSQKQFDFYNANRGFSQSVAPLVFANNLPSTWAHFFLCANGSNGYWMGVNGVMCAFVQYSLISDHIGNALNKVMLNGINPAFGIDQHNAGKLHSIMLTDGITRYPHYGATLTYRVPDDLLSNWYHDTGAVNDPDTSVPDCRPATIVNAGAKYRNTVGTKIAGHVTYVGLNSRRRVGLYTRGGVLLDVTYSRATDGYFEFSGLDTNIQYFVAGFDDAPGAVNAEIADHLTPA